MAGKAKVKMSKGKRSYVRIIDVGGTKIEVSCAVKTGKPMGRWPNGGKKLKAYMIASKEAEAAAMHVQPQFMPKSHEEEVEETEEEKEAELTNEEIIELVSERFDTMNEIVEGAAQGIFRSVVVSGAAGVGKSYGVEAVLTPYAESGEITVEFVSGIVSPVHFYKMLYDNLAPNAVLVLDDTDNLIANEDSLNLLKAALDTKPERKINWRTSSTMLKDENIPKNFIFEGSIIFITNLDFQAIADAEKKMSPHMEALMSRSHYIDLMIHNRDHVALWVEHQIRTNNILVNKKGLTEEQQDMVIDFILKHKNDVRELSIRTAEKISDYILTVPEKWEARSTITQLRNGRTLAKVS